MKVKPVLQGAGLATLYILPIAKRFLDQTLNEAYHHPHPIFRVPLAILSMALLIWIVGWLVFLAIERLPEQPRNTASASLALAFAGLIAHVFLFSRNPVVVRVALWALCSLLALAPIVLFISLRAWRGFFTRCATATGLIYAIAGFGMCVLLPRLAVYSFHDGPPEQTSFRRDVLPPQHRNSRIVWILMDELSYDQTFDHRQPGISLPNFDSFASRSVRFSNQQPSGVYTEFVVPALLRGAQVWDLKTPLHGPVSFRSIKNGAWQPLNQQTTIFAEAWNLGWNPGVVGWYNPYCRLFPDVLARCSWQYSDGIPGLDLPLSYDKSVAQNMLALLPFRLAFQLMFGERDSSTHRRDYEGVMKSAEDLLRDRQIGFVFLHMPVPHPPGIYDRATRQIASSGDYLDNLVLADDALGTLMEVLRSTGNDQQTAVIVSSDHSWRANWWRNGDVLPGSSSWSNEEERATNGGKFDTRPVLMVHLPGTTSGQLVSAPVSVLTVHSIVDSLLREQLHTPADVEKLVDSHLQQSIAARTETGTEVRAGN